MISCSHWGMFEANDSAIEEICLRKLDVLYQNFDRGVGAYWPTRPIINLWPGEHHSYDSKYLHG